MAETNVIVQAVKSADWFRESYSIKDAKFDMQNNKASVKLVINDVMYAKDIKKIKESEDWELTFIVNQDTKTVVEIIENL